MLTLAALRQGEPMVEPSILIATLNDLQGRVESLRGYL